MIIGTAGHIDHGKTTLVRALTGVDTDRLKEEKARGISIELGYAYTPLANGEVLGFIDVPGHERLLHTMVAGACGIDFALLVVAADDGVMPQTREHVAILELLGVARGAVALTKIDRVERQRLDEVAAQVKGLLGPTALKEAPLFALDATATDHPGTTALRDHLHQMVTKGGRAGMIGGGCVERKKRRLLQGRGPEQPLNLRGHFVQALALDAIDLGERHGAARYAEELQDRNMLARLRHHPIVGRHDQQREVDAARPRHHGMQQTLVTGYVDESEHLAVGERGVGVA